MSLTLCHVTLPSLSIHHSFGKIFNFCYQTLPQSIDDFYSFFAKLCVFRALQGIGINIPFLSFLKLAVKPKQSSSKMKQMTLLDLTKKPDDQDTVLPLSPKIKTKKQKTLSEM